MRRLASLPNGLSLVTLISNFGTFGLYGLTNVICIVAFREHHEFSGFKHMVVPVFGALANFACMAFYVIGPTGRTRQLEGADHRGGDLGRLGTLRSLLFLAQLQEARKGYVDGQS